MKEQAITATIENTAYVPPLLFRFVGEDKGIKQSGKSNRRIKFNYSILSFARRSVNENALSVKGKVHCLRNP